jgi:hypothetical protein
MYQARVDVDRLHDCVIDEVDLENAVRNGCVGSQDDGVQGAARGGNNVQALKDSLALQKERKAFFDSCF